MNYQRIYNELIERSKNREKPSCYCEKHHIIPKSMGGSNDKENIAILTAREHYIAHWLLYKIHKNLKMSFALFRMTTPVGNGRTRYSSHTYKTARELHCKELSKRFKGKNHPLYGLLGEKNPCFGTKRSEETKIKISQKAKERYLSLGHHNAKKIIHVESGRIFNSIAEANRTFKGNVSYALRYGGTAEGGHFAYLDDDGNIININNRLKGYSSHKAIKVRVNGVLFKSIGEASIFIGCSSSAVSWALKNNKKCKGFTVGYLSNA